MRQSCSQSLSLPINILNYHVDEQPGDLLPEFAGLLNFCLPLLYGTVMISPALRTNSTGLRNPPTF